MLASGLVEKWRMMYWPKLPGCANDRSPKAMTMTDLQGVFIISLTLTIGSAIILLIERFVNKFRHLFTRQQYNLSEGNYSTYTNRPQTNTYHRTMESPAVFSQLQIARKSIIDLANNADANRKLQRRRKSYPMNGMTSECTRL